MERDDKKEAKEQRKLKFQKTITVDNEKRDERNREGEN